jgi:hypothetical protein
MKKTNNIKPPQWFSLDEEILTSVRLVQLGIKELQGIGFENDFYHLPLLLLSSGFERLMKCMICLKYLDKNGKFPSTEEIRNYRHNLINIKNKIVSECISKKRAYETPALKNDYDFLVNDRDLEKLVEILSDFGQNARYHNLNVIGGEVNPKTDFKARIDEYEIELLKRKAKEDNEDFGDILENKIDEYYEIIYEIIIKKLQRFARALVRQFTLGDLGKEAKRYTGLIKPFLYLMDEDLGKIKDIGK